MALQWVWHAHEKAIPMRLMATLSRRFMPPLNPSTRASALYSSLTERSASVIDASKVSALTALSLMG